LLGGDLLFAGPLVAQEEVQASLSGQLLLAGVPADSGTVILHEVSPEVARAVDSTQVRSDGTFTFSLPHLPIPGSGEVYFVSSRRSGVLYLGPVIGEPATLDSLYVVAAFPSVPAPSGGIRMPITLREIWIQEGPLGWKLTDTFILTNPSPETLVPFGDTGIVWQYPLPEGAQGVRVLEAGLQPGVLRAEGSSIVLSKPLVPGSNRVIVQYDISSLDFDLPLPGEVELVRVVMEEPIPPVQVHGLARMEPAEVEPGVFVAYWAGEGLLDQTIAVRSGEEGSSVPVAIWLSIGLALLLALAGVWGASRNAASQSVAPFPVERRTRSAVLLDIAQLDQDFGEGMGEGSDKGEYLSRRAALMRELDRYR
jgi:hypothetical protein